VDTQTKKRTSLKTNNEDEAQQIVDAKNQAERQPALNLQIARAYLAGSDSGINTRTWLDALNHLVKMKHGANQERWRRAIPDKAFDLIRHLPIIETKTAMSVTWSNPLPISADKVELGITRRSGQW
jgi:hypothetical protein